MGRAWECGSVHTHTLGVRVRYTVTLTLPSGTYDDFTRYKTRYKPLQRVLHVNIDHSEGNVLDVPE
jgi:hypothetical protein